MGQWFPGLALPAAWALMLCACASAGQAAPSRAHMPSGEPVPRYVTLNAAPVNARVGPGEDYKALWQYRVRGLPLQVVEETEGWRRVCDPEGGLGWVRANAIDTRRTVIRLGRSDLILRARPDQTARAIASLSARATAELVKCQGAWCRISVDHAAGWVRAGEVWGVTETAQCRAR